MAIIGSHMLFYISQPEALRDAARRVRVEARRCRRRMADLRIAAGRDRGAPG